MEFIDYFNIGMGAFLIVMGWLCYRFPNIINPYGGLPPERKALVDIEGLRKASFIILAVTGVLLIVTAILSILKVIDETMSAYAMMVLVLVMIVPIIIAMKKYNGYGRDRSGNGLGNNRFSLFRLNLFRLGGGAGSKLFWVLMGLTLVFVVTIFALSSHPQKITVGEETVKISGMYGCEIPIADIVSVELLDEMPPVSMRTNGSATGSRLKGHFLLKNGEKCMIFIRRQAPYIELRSTGNLFYFNADSKEETDHLYQEIKDRKP